MAKTHSFHIPVMGIGFTIDTPIKVAQYGIDSVISLVDDILLEKMRKMYSKKLHLDFQAINTQTEDYRAKRITSYLNLMGEIAHKKFNELREATIETSQGIKEYLSILPERSQLLQEYKERMNQNATLQDIRNWMKEKMTMGSIDVNIMTSSDKTNYSHGEALPTEYNDAHAAFRGFAQSNLKSSIVLSAGMNPRLYNYIENFDDFYPDAEGHINKKIILKVSDFRSAFIQSKYLAKKGIWVSEYRIESGLNCGGHAFASDGHMMGPILQEFKDKRSQLQEEVFSSIIKVLKEKGKPIPSQLSLKISAQGGVGTSEEHQFLLDYYNIDSVGWGTPFMLSPDVVNVDETTLQLMEKATEKDLFLSDISPLGVPFNSIKGNTKDIERIKWINEGTPGSPCPKRYACLNKEFSEKGLCTASRQYQKLKIEQLDKETLSEEAYQKAVDKITIKSCTCVGLGTPALLINGLETKAEGEGVAACPGPNMAYFSKRKTLKEMIQHIYGRRNVIQRNDRPNMFVNELNIYIEYLKNQINESRENFNAKQHKSMKKMAKNLTDSSTYYQDLFQNVKNRFENTKQKIAQDLTDIKQTLMSLTQEINELGS